MYINERFKKMNYLDNKTTITITITYKAMRENSPLICSYLHLEVLTSNLSNIDVTICFDLIVIFLLVFES